MPQSIFIVQRFFRGSELLRFIIRRTRSSRRKNIGLELEKIYNDTKPLLKVNDDVRRAAQTTIEGATDPEEKIARLIRYCRTQLKNLRDDDVTEQQRAKARQNRSPAETLKHGEGTRSLN